MIQMPPTEKVQNPGMSEKQRKHADRDAYLRRPPNQTITMIKSQFRNREPYLFFPYPPFLKMQRALPQDLRRIVQYSQDTIKPSQALTFKITESTHTYNCVVNSLKMAGFRFTTGGNWNVLWTGLFKSNRIKNVNKY